MDSPDVDRAFKALYDKYFRAIYAYFLRNRFSRDDALENAQETFARVYKWMKKGGEAPNWGFLLVTARHILLNIVRHKRDFRVVSIDPDAFEEILGSTQTSPEDEFLLREEKDLLRSAMADLPENMRETLLLRFIGWSYKEIATTKGDSIDTVKSRLRDAKRLLKEALRRQ